MNQTQVLLIISAIGLVIPWAVAAISNEKWPDWLKSVLLAALSIADAVVAEAIKTGNGPAHFSWTTALLGAITAFIAGHSAHASLYRNVPQYRKLQQVGGPRRTPHPGPLQEAA